MCVCVCVRVCVCVYESEWRCPNICDAITSLYWRMMRVYVFT